MTVSLLCVVAQRGPLQADGDQRDKYRRAIGQQCEAARCFDSDAAGEVLVMSRHCLRTSRTNFAITHKTNAG